jgi:hypothetical protein
VARDKKTYKFGLVYRVHREGQFTNLAFSFTERDPRGKAQRKVF